MELTVDVILKGLADATGVVVAVTLLVAAIRSLLDEIKRL